MRWVILYKAIKGALMFVAACVLGIAIWSGKAGDLHGFAVALRQHFTARLAVEAAELFVKIATPGHLVITSLAIGLDGSVGMMEAYLLHRRQRWAIWVVVIASSALIPWELYELVRHFRPLRVVLLLINIGVVIYLGIQSRRHFDRHDAAQAALTG